MYSKTNISKEKSSKGANTILQNKKELPSNKSFEDNRNETKQLKIVNEVVQQHRGGKRGKKKGGGSHGKTLKCKIQGYTNDRDEYVAVNTDVNLGVLTTHGTVSQWTETDVEDWLTSNDYGEDGIKAVFFRHWT